MASASRKIYLPGSRSDIRVPVREISLSGGEPPLRLYDTSGPYTDPDVTLDLKRGLDPLRQAWIRERGDVEELGGPTSTLSPRARERSRCSAACGSRACGGRCARRPAAASRRCTTRGKGVVTEEMAFVAARENVEPELVRDEVARGRAIIPANVNHPELEPMAIGRNFLVKINANIGNSAVASDDRGGGREAALGDPAGAPTR